MESFKDLNDLFRWSNEWLINSALPLWYEKGTDWNRGGFFEHLSIEEVCCNAEFKRLRVLARQIYVFSYGYKIGEIYCKSALIHGLNFLFDKARLDTKSYATTFDLNGNIIDDRQNLYDLSFCVFSLAHAFRVTKDNNLKDAAKFLVEFIFSDYSHPAGGFIQSIPVSLPRGQNPHMHLLESMIEWRLLSNDQIFKDLSDTIVNLFFSNFFQSDTGALLEYYDDHLQPIIGSVEGDVEPGHHFEWIWLLKRYSNISQNELPSWMPLYDFAHKYGICPREDLLRGSLFSNGEIASSFVRLWPHCEWIKAELSIDHNEYTDARIIRAFKALKRFLDCPRKGLWYETFNFDRKVFLDQPSPASSLYHIVLAIDSINNFTSNIR